MNEIERLKANQEIMLGRLNALHAAVHTLVRLNGQPPGPLSAALTDAAQRVEADAVASPLPQRAVDEMQRVLNELSQAARVRAAE